MWPRMAEQTETIAPDMPNISVWFISRLSHLTLSVGWFGKCDKFDMQMSSDFLTTCHWVFYYGCWKFKLNSRSVRWVCAGNRKWQNFDSMQKLCDKNADGREHCYFYWMLFISVFECSSNNICILTIQLLMQTATATAASFRHLHQQRNSTNLRRNILRELENFSN